MSLQIVHQCTKHDVTSIYDVNIPSPKHLCCGYRNVNRNTGCPIHRLYSPLQILLNAPQVRESWASYVSILVAGVLLLLHKVILESSKGLYKRKVAKPLMSYLKKNKKIEDILILLHYGT